MNASSIHTAANATDRFDAGRLVALFQQCAATPTDVPIPPFIEGCMEIRKIVALLGSGFGIAGNDIAEKCGVLRQRLAELEAAAAQRGLADPLPPGAALDPSQDTRVRLTLQHLVQSEVAAGKAAVNSGSYVSGARSTLRLMWFLDFIHALLGGLLADPAASLSTAARAAYRQALEPHHGFVVKHAIGAAMNFLPSRQAFFQGLAGPAAQPGASQPQAAPPQVMAPQPSGGTGMPMEMGGGSGMGGGMQMLQTTSAMTPSDVEAKLGVFLASVEPLRAELWRFYGQLGLTNLP